MSIYLIMQAQLAASYEVPSLHITDTILENGELEEIMNITVFNNTQDIISITLPQGAERITLNNHAVKEASELNISPCQQCTVKITYTLKGAVRETRYNNFDFSRTLNLPKQPAEMNYKVILPPASTIPLTDKTNIIPVDGIISTDGASIMVIWNQKKPQLPIIYHVGFQGPEVAENENTNYVSELRELPVQVMIFFSLLIGIGIGTFLQKKIQQRSLSPEGQQRKVIPSSLFTPDEQAIIKMIVKHHHHIKQKDLTKEMNWSKSKVSAVITNLEYKQVVRREKTGRNYDIYLESAIDDL